MRPRQGQGGNGRRACWRKVLAGSLLVLGCVLVAFQRISRHRHYHTCTPPPHQRTYDGESVSWTACGSVAGRALECGSIDVPMDQFNASNNGPPDSLRKFTIPLARLRGGAHATRNILLNPGGPGASGTQFVHRLGAQIGAIVGDGFHLVGFDPRGVNASRPAASCYASDADRQRLAGAVRAKRLVADSGDLFAWAAGYVRACADELGEHGAFLNTPQTAADMNSILDALGQPDMYYLGFSYGTLLGQTYAALFPGRARRVAIDGVANQFHWYGEQLDRDVMTDSERALAGFADECVKAGPGGCALAGLADTPARLADRLVAAIDRLRDDPLGVYVNSTLFGTLDYWDVWYGGVFPALCKPATWRALADSLAALLGIGNHNNSSTSGVSTSSVSLSVSDMLDSGNATAAFLSYGKPGTDRPSAKRDAEVVITLNDGASGAAGNWPRTRKGLLDILEPYADASAFGADGFAFALYFAKQAWGVARTHTYTPKRGVTTAHPLLVLSTTFDPVCPLVSARSARDAFVGARLLEVKGYGHCTLSVPSLCMARHVRRYFEEGVLPDDGAQCEADGNPYFGNLEMEEEAAAAAGLLSDDDRRIRLAQLELARDVSFKTWWT
ncbi:Alpha/Beta hydrolase protein [Lasiosphaeria miniovina]|uniref:Alpha/Beta hydrolase protein n=1 Tax=Lasiosphaeria miniovina TaxID=1954250 RepID=A0AA40DQP5_9PEZI|nr:Alpha/Beta hydrolase protein [Lasiosphaeria miniovina]KAK0712579.1 Alpha/Beta hydrolase protein [Lasiosphaeria miniovina]